MSDRDGKVISFRGSRRVSLGTKGPGGVGGGGGNGMLEKLEKRVEKLEGDMVAVRQDLGIIKATMATKEDLHKEINLQTWRMIGAMFVLIGAALTAAKLLF